MSPSLVLKSIFRTAPFLHLDHVAAVESQWEALSVAYGGEFNLHFSARSALW
jgi:hypothetical protein